MTDTTAEGRLRSNPVGYRRATEKEIEESRRQLRDGLLLAEAAVRRRGVKLHHRIAAIRSNNL